MLGIGCWGLGAVVARGSRWTVRKTTEPGRHDRLILNIYDDGKGFDSSDSHEGFGLVNIRQRVNHLKGSFKIQSIAGTGTSAEITIKFKNNGIYKMGILDAN